jgi:competence protein ComEA
VGINRFFDFSDTQLKVLAGLSVVLLLVSGYHFVRANTSPAETGPELPVLLGSAPDYTGLFVLDPNTAPADSLELLPGIGAILADRIVAYRQHNRFEQEIDITNVKGIGPRLYERLKPYLKVQRP